MQNVIQQISSTGFSGNFTVKVPKRADRSVLQLDAMKAAEKAKENPRIYIDFSEKILEEYLVAINAMHDESGISIGSRDALEYIAAESLIAEIVGTVVGGQRLGKPIA